jgi:hypothetical protein
MGLSFGFRGAVSPSACTCGAATLGVSVRACVAGVAVGVVGVVGVGASEICSAPGSDVDSVASEGSPSVQAERARLASEKMNRVARKRLEQRDIDMRRRVAGGQGLAEKSYFAAHRSRSNHDRWILRNGLLAFAKLLEHGFESGVARLESQRHLDVLDGARQIARLEIGFGLAVKLSALGGCPGALDLALFVMRVLGFSDLDAERIAV